MATTAPRASAIVVSDTFIVRVGEEKKDYNLHKGLLIHYSEYFRGALSGNFSETDEGVNTLEDIKQNWLYEKKIPGFKRTALGMAHNSTLLYTYILADRFMVSELKDTILSSLFDINEVVKMAPSYILIAHAFENLTEHNPFLHFLVDMFYVNDVIEDCDPKLGNADQIHRVPQEAFARIFLMMRAIKGMTEEEKKLKRSAYKV